MRVVLTVTAGPRKGARFDFEEHDTFIVGRGKQAHFQLLDKYFSRNHFLVEVNPPRCRLVDLGSSNGTYVNQTKVTASDLRDGDEIQAGDTLIRVSLEGAEPQHQREYERTVPDVTLETTPVYARPQSTEAFAIAVPPPSTVAPSEMSCVVCDVALPEPASRIPSGDELPSNVCPACRQQIRRQPQPIEGYRIVRELGRGGMGVVYLAIRTADGSVTALKTIIPARGGTKKEVERFIREATVLRELVHPNIVAFREMGTSGGQFFFAMDYVRGTDAGRLLRDHGPLPIGRAVNLVCQMLEGLEYAHASGFVHRDIKPANLLVTEREGRETGMLADFGLARVYQTTRFSGLTMTGEIAGTFAFMAPEQMTDYRNAKPPADLYSAGATLYRLLTDAHVYDFGPGRRPDILMVLEGEPVPIQSRRGGIPSLLAQAIHRSLARQPTARWPDATAMREALLPFSGS